MPEAVDARLQVGADVGLHVQHTMLADETMGNRMAGADPQMLQTMVDKGWLGRKSGKGFYTYSGKKKAPNQEALDFIATNVKQRDAGLDAETIVERYLTRFVNEAARCVQEGIIKTPVDGARRRPARRGPIVVPFARARARAGDLGAVFGGRRAPYWASAGRRHWRPPGGVDGAAGAVAAVPQRRRRRAGQAPLHRGDL